jgi:hypothetical protein
VISNALISFLIEQLRQSSLEGHSRESVLFGEDPAINNDYVRTPKSRPVYLYHSFGYRAHHIVCFEGSGALRGGSAEFARSRCSLHDCARLQRMPLILILIILLLVFGGGGYYMGPGLGYYGGGGVSLVLLIVILFLLFGGRRSRL